MFHLYYRVYRSCHHKIICHTRRRLGVLSTTLKNKSKPLDVSTPLDLPQKQLIFKTCAGVRKSDGKPCRRRFLVNPNDISASTLTYCHDHRPSSTKPAFTNTIPTQGTSSSSTALIPHILTSFSTQAKQSIETSPVYDCWSLWIGKHIKTKKRNQIVREMLKPFSEKDEAGYLYAYRLTQGPRVPTTLYCYFKIGRSTNPTRRMFQVKSTCHYHPKLLDIIPRKVKNNQEDDISRHDQLQKCPLSHRVERLIHLELTSLYPITGGFKCQVCGTTHREWFRVKRPLVQVEKNKTRRMTDQEVWMTKIRPIMLHWIRYGVVASASLQASSSC
ncbi:meiotically up-regulated gene 113-domain-containing protein [Halteromyces radiatus]|uniref:meiotically up-regulated gene 113-domain-containing protein n=1 Tax=Halteromyces radiatus TaxID=101107 RepID=UPI002220488C|nr:meiotically up-regulated gene 113-domain-containing protein [Halteromyces radiatus]KAI8086765.1 meiotically up-regulated gene 113-domain-containing protein [Halteromyces radiatus]